MSMGTQSTRLRFYQPKLQRRLIASAGEAVNFFLQKKITQSLAFLNSACNLCFSKQISTQSPPDNSSNYSFHF
jgi:hypothetical protein